MRVYITVFVIIDISPPLLYVCRRLVDTELDWYPHGFWSFWAFTYICRPENLNAWVITLGFPGNFGESEHE